MCACVFVYVWENLCSTLPVSTDRSKLVCFFFKDLKFLCLGVKVAHGENHQEFGRLTALPGNNLGVRCLRPRTDCPRVPSSLPGWPEAVLRCAEALPREARAWRAWAVGGANPAARVLGAVSVRLRREEVIAPGGTLA